MLCRLSRRFIRVLIALLAQICDQSVSFVGQGKADPKSQKVRHIRPTNQTSAVDEADQSSRSAPTCQGIKQTREYRIVSVVRIRPYPLPARFSGRV